jgi:hypothetical protein
MIREIAAQLNAYLAALGVPYGVEYGPTGGETCWRDGLISVERDERGDTFGPVQAVHRNPKLVTTRSVGVLIRIWTQTSKRGAAQWEHERRAERVLDFVLSGMAEIAATRGNTWTPQSGAFIVPEDLAASENAGGAVYELRGTFDRGVKRAGIMGANGVLTQRPTTWASGVEHAEHAITAVAPADGTVRLKPGDTPETW